MTRLEIWKVFGVYYITRVDLTNKYKTTLCFASPKESFKGLWTTFSLSFVCVCGEKDLEQLYFLLGIRIMQTPLIKEQDWIRDFVGNIMDSISNKIPIYKTYSKLALTTIFMSIFL